MKHNIGCDIGKYFHGGYSLDGNMKNKTWRGHNHSNYARMIVNDCIIAKYEDHMQTESHICRVKTEEIYIVNSKVRTFFLETIDKKPVDSFKRFYPGLDYLQKYFFVRTLQDPKVVRQYTVCYTMDP